MLLFIRDLSKSRGIEVYREKNQMFEWKLAYGLPNESMVTVNLWNSLSIHGKTLVWLVFMLQYFSSPFFMTISILVNKLDNCFAVHLLERAIKQCFTGNLCSLGVQYR